jgi:hypothetical protein
MAVMRWGLLIVTGLMLAAPVAHAQTSQPAPAPLKLRFSGNDFTGQPRQLAPGASWEEPQLAPDGAKPSLGVRWSGSNDDWDVSAAVAMVEESRLNASDFQTGGLFETEAAVVRRVGPFRVGAAGYSARNAGENVGRGPKLGQSRWRGSAAGPVIGYDAVVAGQPTTLSLRWFREIGTPGENGDTVSAAFALRF